MDKVIVGETNLSADKQGRKHEKPSRLTSSFRPQQAMKLNCNWVTGLRLWLLVGRDAALPLHDPGVWDGWGVGLCELLAAVRQSGRKLGPSRSQA